MTDTEVAETPAARESAQESARKSARESAQGFSSRAPSVASRMSGYNNSKIRGAYVCLR